jgi:hypothetical protein
LGLFLTQRGLIRHSLDLAEPSWALFQHKRAQLGLIRHSLDLAEPVLA